MNSEEISLNVTSQSVYSSVRSVTAPEHRTLWTISDVNDDDAFNYRYHHLYIVNIHHQCIVFTIIIDKPSFAII